MPFPVGFYSVQRWAVAPGSVVLKCISCKFFLLRRVIYKKKRRKRAFPTALKSTVKPEAAPAKRKPNKGKKKITIIKI